ncbi:Carbohydrate sulfotransferase 15-like [Homarus americanus]|uniref:Carbohydrate sulfotransferase 15-like n=1 Tax=Homarus americanus TaxID=6706 RepID=A0A8J5K1S2_HOMAM|nr:Carbohydrate sulfotransferase 15-like [Homarus americanus]
MRYRYKKQSDVILRCLPYFFLIGQPKCATTDVFQRINIHPDVIEPMVKGPHWWTRRRYGPPYSTHPVTLTEYLDVFNASKIEGETINSFEAPHKWFHEKITGDCSTSTLWDSSATMSYLHSVMSGDVHEFITRKLLARRLVSTFTSVKNSSHAKINSSENTRVNDVDEHLQEFKYPQYHGTQDGIVLPFTVADAIHSVLPKSQIIAVIREPVSRNTLSTSGVTGYGVELQLPKKLKDGDSGGVADVVADGVDSPDVEGNLTEEEEKRVNMAPVRNKNRNKPDIGKMFESTANILREFYEPYNRDLACLLQDSRFTWQDIYSRNEEQHPD